MPRVRSEVLMLPASLSRTPAAFVLLCLSLPARSTNDILGGVWSSKLYSKHQHSVIRRLSRAEYSKMYNSGIVEFNQNINNFQLRT